MNVGGVVTGCGGGAPTAYGERGLGGGIRSCRAWAGTHGDTLVTVSVIAPPRQPHRTEDGQLEVAFFC